jgi:beta-lactam-binding protein with PASTA domain
LDQVTVPDVIGLKPAPAHAALIAAGLRYRPMNYFCGKGSVLSQSVVDELEVPGPPPNIHVGAVPLSPGTKVIRHFQVGIVWSGCYGGGTRVPNVVNLHFNPARHAIQYAGLVPVCQSEASTSQSEPTTVQSQTPAPGTAEVAGVKVTFVMYKCQT